MGVDQGRLATPDGTEVLHMSVNCDEDAASDVTGAIVRSVGHLRASKDILEAVEIVLSEVINNIVEHAYRGISGGLIEISVVENDCGVSFHFFDQGHGMPGNVLPTGKLPNSNCAIPELPEGGFGWFLIYSLTDNLQYFRENGGNRLSFQLSLDELGADI